MCWNRKGRSYELPNHVSEAISKTITLHNERHRICMYFLKITPRGMAACTQPGVSRILFVVCKGAQSIRLRTICDELCSKGYFVVVILIVQCPFQHSPSPKMQLFAGVLTVLLTCPRNQYVPRLLGGGVVAWSHRGAVLWRGNVGGRWRHVGAGGSRPRAQRMWHSHWHLKQPP